jgi:hypothetical protein
VSYQLCTHDNPSRDEALRCANGGDYVQERETDRLIELRPWERANGETLTMLQARMAVNEAMVSLDPRLAEPMQHVQAWAIVEQRGKRFDVTIYHADALFRRFESAIRDTLGPAVDRCGVFAFAGYSNPSTRSPPLTPSGTSWSATCAGNKASRDRSRALRRLASDVDDWPVPPAGLFAVEESAFYLRSTSPMTVAHSFIRSLYCK